MAFDIPLFIKYRISMLFLLAFQYLAIPHEGRKYRAISIVGITFLLTSIIDAVRESSPNLNALNSAGYTFLLIIFVQSCAQLISSKPGISTLFTGIVSSVIVLPGDMVWNLALYYSKSFIIATIFQCAIHGLLLWIFYKYIQKIYLVEVEVGHNEELLLLSCICALFYLLVYTTILHGESSGSSMNFYILPVLIMILLLSISFLVFYRYLRFRKTEIQRENDEAQLLIYAESIKREADTVQKLNEETAILRHDIRHFTQTLNTYIENGETDQALTMLHQIDDRLDHTIQKRYCENIAVNGILSTSATLAQRQGVEFVCKTEVPSELNKINVYEFATVISNALENAILAASKAEEGNRYVHITISQIKAQLSVTVVNSFAGKLAIDSRSGLPKSERGEGHGYGMRSTQAFAEKSGGFFHFDVEDHVFTLKLLVTIN